MRSEKRLWIYSGCAIPKRVGLVKRFTSNQKRNVSSILLVGTESVSGLVPVLLTLARDAKVEFTVNLDGSVDDLCGWVSSGKLENNVIFHKPDVVVLALKTTQIDCATKAASVIRNHGAHPIWLFSDKNCSISNLSPMVYAGWASRIWSCIHRRK